MGITRTAAALAVGIALGIALPVSVACAAQDTTEGPAVTATAPVTAEAPAIPAVSPTLAPRSADTVAAAPVTVAPATVKVAAPTPAPVKVHTVKVAGKAYTLYPCTTEDDVRDCYWDARTRGNGQGRSFVVLNGTIYYAAAEVR